MRSVLWLIILTSSFAPARAQSFEARQLLLDWQKLTQEKQILSDLYKGYQILSKGYTTISDLSHGSFDLHKAFLDGLLAVSPAVRTYHRVADIIRLQENIVSQYHSAWSLFRQDPHFSAGELELIGNVYAGLFDRTAKNLTDLANVLTDGLFRASDGERLDHIDDLYRDMAGSQAFLTSFNQQATLVSLQRSVDLRDYQSVRQLYGLNG
ncbi:MAG TPA: hypothetical protein VHE34_22365 [Puia sp.]|uniref:TerB family tellurite resistance protein n=1 Tax=Puia sp. TaxID=2045100 RepID=UPI002BEBD5DD|nr:TerB family tellurite resistance protein [Puia sp.]HVU97992.1 hypothetical protein [Puia sp.]